MLVLAHAQVAVRGEEVAVQHMRVKSLIRVQQTLTKGRLIWEAADGVFEFLQAVEEEALCVATLGLLEVLPGVAYVLRRRGHEIMCLQSGLLSLPCDKLGVVLVPRVGLFPVCQVAQIQLLLFCAGWGVEIGALR